MWHYNYAYSYADELYHHGIKGMKWGRRRFQNEDGSLTKAGQRRYNKLERKVNKITDFENKANSKILDERATNRAKTEASYDKKIARAEKKGQTDKYYELRGEKKEALDDFDRGTKYIETAMKNRTENRTALMKLNMKALSDPSIKESESYRNAKKWAENQSLVDTFYSRNYTLLMESSAVARGESWIRGKTVKQEVADTRDRRVADAMRKIAEDMGDTKPSKPQGGNI